MNGTCIEVRRALEDGQTSPEQAVHVQGCAGCRLHAALLAALAAAAPREVDEGAVRAILAARPVARWQRRRVATWLPVAAGLLLVGVGLALLGGVPGSGAMALVPGAFGALAGLAGSAVADTLAVVRGSGEAVRALAGAGGVWVVVWLLVAALGGGWGVLALARRRAGERRG